MADRSARSNSGVVGTGGMLHASVAELGSLLEIENDPILKLQLRNWEEQAKAISRKIERKENRTYAVKNEIYQLLGFYLVLQGVVLTAVAQASVLTCAEWWSPFILSSITSIVAIYGVRQKLQNLHDVNENLREERISYQVLTRNIQLFKRKGNRFDFVADVRRGEQHSHTSGISSSSSSSATREVSFSLRSTAWQLVSFVFSSDCIMFLSLVAFSYVVIISCNTILCKEGTMSLLPTVSIGSSGLQGHASHVMTVEKFSGENFSLWKFEMIVLFKANKLWPIVSGKALREEVRNKNEWDDRDSIACMYITQGVDRNHLQQLLDCETSTQMWQKLISIHEQSAIENVHVLQRKMYPLKMKERGSIT